MPSNVKANVGVRSASRSRDSIPKSLIFLNSAKRVKKCWLTYIL
ncbi:hypothetical protein PPIS_a3830 [Pseudoalteromonas piscicida]|uniref:Uncharacterized protein n=1 Tax=Pseudoalteromonas piscicida TaxID=43662 RepID=A0ABN5CGC3_PSEO7|nr:hypothetical protein PPIS_a3830 [Pseudoalteromonas piscicida]